MFFLFPCILKKQAAPWLSSVFMHCNPEKSGRFAGIVINAGFLIKEKKHCLRKAHFWVTAGRVGSRPYYLLLGSASEQRL
jgi:hypothetical protein